VYRDSQCLRGKHVRKFLDQLEKIMVIGELKRTKIGWVNKTS
jgi:hypothetical protein